MKEYLSIYDENNISLDENDSKVSVVLYFKSELNLSFIFNPSTSPNGISMYVLFDILILLYLIA